MKLLLLDYIMHRYLFLLLIVSSLPKVVVGVQQNLRHQQQRQLSSAGANHSVLWDADGEPWVSSSSSSMLRNFTDVGFMSGNVAIPDWPIGVNITDFGAVPDDLISDAQALRAAVAACPDYHAVYIPNGRYIIDEAIVFNNATENNFVIRGESRDGTVLFFPKQMHEIEQAPESKTYFISFERSTSGGGTNRGIENLSLILRDERKSTGYFFDPYKTKQMEPHFFGAGENMISFGEGNTDSWARNLYIKNANTAIRVVGIFTKRISITDIVIDKFLMRTDVDMEQDGHVGIASNAREVLIHNVMITGRMNHELDLNGARNTVYSRISTPNFSPDFHAQGNRENLYTEFDMGSGKPIWRDRDNVNGGRKNLQWETFWGMKSKSDFSFLDPADQCVMVGIPNQENTSIGIDYHHEAISPNALVPANVYLAQMAETTGKVLPPDVTLTVPPLPFQDKVVILLPTDDAHVGLRSADQDVNYGFADRIVVRKGAAEGYLKFDLSNLGANYGDIYHAKLKMAVKFAIKDNFQLQVKNMTDTSWSEETLTYNNRPTSDSVIGDVSLFKDNIPEFSYIELDITDNLNNALAAGDTAMSLHLQGSTKDGGLAIKAREFANPVHLVVYLEQASAPEESQWTPTDDAFTDSIVANRDTNYGSHIRVRMRGTRNYGFMKFDLTGLGNTMVNPVVTSAKLIANTKISLKDAFDLQILNVTDNSWNEGTLTYNNKPDAYDIIAEKYLDKSILPDWDWVEFDITTHVQHVYGLGQSVFSLFFVGVNNKDAALAFKSTADPDAPYLEVSVLDDVPALPVIPMGPDKLTGLQATTVGPASVTLTWNVGTAALAPITYNVYRYDSTGYVVKAMGLVTLTFTDYRVATNSSNIVFPLAYVVTAVDIAGDESEFSDNVTVSLP